MTTRSDATTKKARREWIEQAKALLDDWGRTLDDVESRVGGAKNQLRADIRGRLDSVRRKATNARTTWASIAEGVGSVSDEAKTAWDANKEAIERSLEEVRSAVPPPSEPVQQDTRASSSETEARTAESGDTVRVRFVGWLDDGTVFDRSSRLDSLEITLGEGDVIPGVEEAIRGLAVGQRLTTRVPPSEGFGQRRDDLILTLAKDHFPGDDPTPGESYEVRRASGSPVRVRVLHVLDESVKVDANHPLAGQPLNFDLELVKIA